MAIIDVVKWDGRATELAHKEGSTELSTWTQLIVNESQEAVLYRGGAMDGPFGPGRHTLKTENIPVVAGLLKLPFGRSPFTAEVWYVNRVIALDIKWATEAPIQLMDPVHKIMIPVEADGQYGVQVVHTRKFLVKLVGTMPDFTQEKLTDYLRGMILSIAKSTIAREIVQKRVSILEIATQLVELSAAVRAALEIQLEEFGLRLVNFFVSAIHVAENDPSIVRLRDAYSRRAEMDIIGFSYQQERSLDVLEAAAGNQGSGGVLMGAGVGLGAGMAAGSVIGQGFGALGTSLQSATPAATCAPEASGPPAASPAGEAACGACGAPIAMTDKFCSSCGARTAAEPRKCGACGAQLKPGARFCGDCGAAQTTAQG